MPEPEDSFKKGAGLGCGAALGWVFGSALASLITLLVLLAVLALACAGLVTFLRHAGSRQGHSLSSLLAQPDR
jgi:hypothetical protein